MGKWRGEVLGRRSHEAAATAEEAGSSAPAAAAPTRATPSTTAASTSTKPTATRNWTENHQKVL